jgi:Uncharacterized alpha/beta hydrolase domain (DUF2235)
VANSGLILKKPLVEIMTINVNANIVILSDGTGNSQSSPFKTNVWRIYKYLELNDEQMHGMTMALAPHQISFQDILAVSLDTD